MTAKSETNEYTTGYLQRESVVAYLAKRDKDRREKYKNYKVFGPAVIWMGARKDYIEIFLEAMQQAKYKGYKFD